MRDDEFVNFFAPLAYRAADKFFKFVSWAILITVVRFAQQKTGSPVLSWIEGISIGVFIITLMFQSFHLMLRTPGSLNVPDQLRRVSKAIQIITGLAMLAFITSPYLLVDQILIDLAKVRIN